jgi:hypothetical protein
MAAFVRELNGRMKIFVTSLLQADERKGDTVVAVHALLHPPNLIKFL